MQQVFVHLEADESESAGLTLVDAEHRVTLDLEILCVQVDRIHAHVDGEVVDQLRFFDQIGVHQHAAKLLACLPVNL